MRRPAPWGPNIEMKIFNKLEILHETELQFFLNHYF